VPEIPGFVNALHANEPNPFNPSTTIRYGLASPGRVDLRIHDLRGRVVRTLVAAVRPAGWHLELWDGRDDAGRRVASGVYFYRIEAGAFVQARKMLLLK
jgi:flagellar hook assembly protein FlgD